MLYKTHKAGAVLGMLVAFEVMKNQGWLLDGVNPLVQLAMMYPAASWGGTFSDLDHQIDSVKEQTPFNLLVHRLLHLTSPRHRSWQTHSVLVTGGMCALILALVFLGNVYYGYAGSVGWIYIRLVTVGGVVGILSHLLLDAFTTGGIHLIPGTKIRFVFKHPAFSTGGLWESIVYFFLMSGIILFLVHMVFPYFWIGKL